MGPSTAERTIRLAIAAITIAAAVLVAMVFSEWTGSDLTATSRPLDWNTRQAEPTKGLRGVVLVPAGGAEEARRVAALNDGMTPSYSMADRETAPVHLTWQQMRDLAATGPILQNYLSTGNLQVDPGSMPALDALNPNALRQVAALATPALSDDSSAAAMTIRPFTLEQEQERDWRDDPWFATEDVFRGKRREAPRARQDKVTVSDSDVALQISEDALLRATSASDGPEYLDLRLQQVWRIGERASLGIGWQHMRGVESNDAPPLLLRRDAVLLELRFGF